MALDTSDFVLDTSDFVPDTVGGGRGTINPPLIGEPQPVPMRVPRRGVIPRDPYVAQGPDGVVGPADFKKALVQGIDNSGVVPLVEGGVRGASWGLIDPAAAGLESVVTGRPLQDTLARHRAERIASEKANPISSTTGEVVGSIASGSALSNLVKRVTPVAAAKWAGIPALTVQQGTQGAVNAAAQGGDAGEVASAGGMAAGVAGGLGTAGAAASKVANKVASSHVIEQLQTLLKEKPPGWKNTLEKIFGQTDEVMRSEGQTVVGATRDMISALKTGELKVNDIDTLSTASNKVLRVPMSEHGWNIGRQVGISGLSGLSGWGANAAYDAVTGKPIVSPEQAFFGGMALGGAGALATTKGQVIGDLMTRGLTNRPIQNIASATIPATMGAVQTELPKVIRQAKELDTSDFVPD